MKVYLMNTNASTEVILVEGKKMFVCQTDRTGKLDGVVDIYADNATEQLKTFFTTELINDFSDLNPEHIFDFLADEYNTNEPDAPSLSFICYIPNAAGRKLRELRIKNNYTFKQLSQLTNIAVRTLENWESGARYLKDINKIKILANVFKVDFKDFI